MFRFISACFASFGAFVAAVAMGVPIVPTLIIAVVVFFVTNGLGD
jgi:hypothetical protein